MDFVMRLVEEHNRQSETWGASHDDEHTLGNWHEILEEYTGRLLEDGYDDPHVLVQIAAICFSAYESLARKEA